jgi:hypothetical protein
VHVTARDTRLRIGRILAEVDRRRDAAFDGQLEAAAGQRLAALRQALDPLVEAKLTAHAVREAAFVVAPELRVLKSERRREHDLAVAKRIGRELVDGNFAIRFELGLGLSLLAIALALELRVARLLGFTLALAYFLCGLRSLALAFLGEALGFELCLLALRRFGGGLLGGGLVLCSLLRCRLFGRGFLGGCLLRLELGLLRLAYDSERRES